MQSTTMMPFLLKTVAATLNLSAKSGGKRLSKENIFTFLKRISNINWMGHEIIPVATA
jgi:hypothetical protein